MNHLKRYNEYILESVKTIDYVYDTYYSAIPRDNFDKIVASDPTTKSNKIGIYCKWLLNLYISNNLKLEDLYKATDYLKVFHRFKHKFPIEQRNINHLKGLPQLSILIEPFENPDAKLLSKSENMSKAFNNSFQNYDMYIPSTYEESRDLGRNTRWCTAADSKEGRNNFKEYNSKGIIYILISKTDPIEKYQFHFEEMQFMDRYDNKINFIQFLNINTDIKEYFKTEIDDFMKYLKFENYKKITSKEYPDKIYYALNGEVLVALDKKTKVLDIHSDEIWRPFSSLYGLDYSETSDVIKYELKKIFGFDGIEPRYISHMSYSEIWNQITNQNNKSINFISNVAKK